MAITNEAELKKALQGQIQSAVLSLLDATLDENQKKVDTTVYGAYSGEYQRTGEFEEAWKVTEENSGGNIAGGTFEYAPEKITTISAPQHAAVADGANATKGASSAEYLADLIYQGHGGIWHMPARNAFKKLDKWLSERQVVSQFKSGLKKAGLKVTKAGGADKTII